MCGCSWHRSWTGACKTRQQKTEPRVREQNNPTVRYEQCVWFCALLVPRPGALLRVQTADHEVGAGRRGKAGGCKGWVGGCRSKVACRWSLGSKTDEGWGPEDARSLDGPSRAQPLPRARGSYAVRVTTTRSRMSRSRGRRQYD